MSKVKYGISVYIPDGFDKYEVARDIINFFQEMSGMDEDFEEAGILPIVHEGIEARINYCLLPREMSAQFEKWFYEKFTKQIA